MTIPGDPPSAGRVLGLASLDAAALVHRGGAKAPEARGAGTRALTGDGRNPGKGGTKTMGKK